MRINDLKAVSDEPSANVPLHS